MPRATGSTTGRRTLIASPERPQWWLEQAKWAALQIADAPHPSHVRTHSGPDTYAVTRRVGHEQVTDLVVAKAHLKSLTGTRAAKWLSAAAAARARWPRRAQRHGNLGPTLLLLAAVLAALFATAAPSLSQTWAWACAAATAGIVGGAWAWWRRRRDVLIAWSGDDQAVRLVGIEAARDVLGDEGRPDLYRTALHEWWAAKDSLRPANRLARLEQRAGRK